MAEVRIKMSELLAKAKAIKNDPNVKHTLSQSQIREANENTMLMMPHQLETIKGENDEEIEDMQ